MVYCSSGLSGKYTVLAVCQIVHCASGLSFLTAVCLIRQRLRRCGDLMRAIGYVVVEDGDAGLCLNVTSLELMIRVFDWILTASLGPDIMLAMGTIRDPIAEGTEGVQELGPERARVYSNLSPEDKDKYNADIRATNILLQGLQKDIYTLINHYTKAKDI
ncbi:hypothetical protein Tco_1174207 [Tanacetum coccineum]